MNAKALLRFAACHALPMLAAVWLFWTMLDSKHMQGWFDFQDSLHRAAKPLFAYPTWEFVLAGACVFASFLLVMVQRPGLGAVLAFATMAFVEIMWIGRTQ